MKKIDYKSYQKPSDYMKFDQGKTTIRIVSSGAFVKRHGMKTTNGYIPLGICAETSDCKYCLQGNEPKQKWTWIAFNRDRKEVRVLDAGPMIGDQICKIGQKYGDPQDFDILVSKSGEGKSTKYSISKGEQSPITAEERALIDPTKHYLIRKYFSEGAESK